jgi:hypothetical protein
LKDMHMKKMTLISRVNVPKISRSKLTTMVVSSYSKQTIC